MKIIEVVTDSGHQDTLNSIAKQHGIKDIWWCEQGPDNRYSVRLLVGPDKRQTILDALQSVLGSSENYRIVVIPVEASLPLSNAKNDASDEEKQEKILTTTREELYSKIEKGSRLDSNYLLLVLLSTIVAAIGLIEDNVAVLIGAMVIAPLLGPNIALALAAALGDHKLGWQALKTAIAGLGLALTVSIAIGLLWPVNLTSAELMARTDAQLASAALALAAGAAAVLSLTTGLPSVLVGVMVAVALLPPTATIGLMISDNRWELALGAGLLLAINIVCVNIAAKLVLMVRGIKPRKGLEIKKAQRSLTLSLLIWGVLLLILLATVVYRVVPASVTG
ncbi:MAG: TIGR00341 family protein [Gammaproteobacteria bacterium]|nr:TIGR00341 family protein [Gammaproteobacteria bacterium]